MTTKRVVNALATSPVWYKIDATGQHVGRLASSIAQLLMGYNKPFPSKEAMVGDRIVVINADKIEFTGICFLSYL